MKISFSKINPGGNITALVKGTYNPMQRKKISRALMKHDVSIEQVGFWNTSRRLGVDAVLTMAGGEFCGNALRALGYLLHIQTQKKNIKLISAGLPTVFPVQAAMQTSSVSLPLALFSVKGGVCTLPGISHIVTEENVPLSKIKKRFREEKIHTKKAAGVITYAKDATGHFVILPTVWVREINTLYKETACASGSLALAYVAYMRRGTRKTHILQPSGSLFATRVIKDSIVLSGPVLSIEEKELILK